jgi:hypothetical protein
MAGPRPFRCLSQFRNSFLLSLANGGEERTYTTKHGTTADLKRTVIPLARSFERGWKMGVTAPGEAFAPAWHRSRPPSLDRRTVTRHPITPSDRREPDLQISAGIQG